MKKNHLLALFALGCLFFWGLPALAANFALNTTHPDRYVVQPGDTLWTIAARFLKEPADWEALWRANPAIQDPYAIYPGEVLTLRHFNGGWALDKVVKLSPQIRVAGGKRIPVIPYEDIRPFLEDVDFLTPTEYITRPYIFTVHKGRDMAFYDKWFYARQVCVPIRKNYAIFRKGAKYIDCHTKKVLALEVVRIGEASLVQPGDPSVFLVTYNRQEIVPGNILMDPGRRMSHADLKLRRPICPIVGYVMSSLKQMEYGEQISQFRVIVINQGFASSLRRGDVLGIYRQGPMIMDRFTPVQFLKPQDKVMIPDYKIAEMVLFKVYRNVSLGLILREEEPVHIYDLVSNP